MAAVSAARSRGVTATVIRPSHPGSSTPIVVTPAGTDSAAISGTRHMPSPAATSPNRAGRFAKICPGCCRNAPFLRHSCSGTCGW
jgi:hypothetical protein